MCCTAAEAAAAAPRPRHGVDSPHDSKGIRTLHHAPSPRRESAFRGAREPRIRDERAAVRVDPRAADGILHGQAVVDDLDDESEDEASVSEARGSLEADVSDSDDGGEDGQEHDDRDVSAAGK